jgi:hypothetical protein
LCNIPRRGHQRDTVPGHRLYTATAALAAVADHIETIQTGILEPGRMHMSPPVLCLQQRQSLVLGKPAAAPGVVLKDEVNERLSYDHADLGRLTMTGTSMPATAFVDSHIRGSLQQNLPGNRIGYDLLQITEGYLLVECDYGFGMLQGEHLAMVMVCAALPSPLV